MTALWALLLGYGLDLLFGDPHWLPHPVVLMGKCIAGLEKGLRRQLPDTPGGQLAGGAVLALVLPLGSFGLAYLLLWCCGLVHPGLRLAVESFLCYQVLATKSLRVESMKVYRELEKGDLPAARQAVGRIVGRDTQALTAEGVTKAAVETVAENTGDGVVAPMVFLALGGAPLGLLYKAINTMDSMVGYKNDRYLHFGRAAAKLDDAANYVPARIAALLWILAAPLAGGNMRGAWRIWRRDRRNHASPNSAQTESACAGSLGVQLAGPASYFGKLVDKPTIGDATRESEPEDILRANRNMVWASVLGLVIGLALRFFVWLMVMILVWFAAIFSHLFF